MGRLAGKVAVVTGGSRGAGRAIVELAVNLKAAWLCVKLASDEAFAIAGASIDADCGLGIRFAT